MACSSQTITSSANATRRLRQGSTEPQTNITSQPLSDAMKFATLPLSNSNDVLDRATKNRFVLSPAQFFAKGRQSCRVRRLLPLGFHCGDCSQRTAILRLVM